jgi:hypothetical protein
VKPASPHQVATRQARPALYCIHLNRAAPVAFRIDGDDRFAVLEQHRRRMTEVLSRLAIDNHLPLLFTSEVNQRDRLVSGLGWLRFVIDGNLGLARRQDHGGLFDLSPDARCEGGLRQVLANLAGMTGNDDFGLLRSPR